MFPLAMRAPDDPPHLRLDPRWIQVGGWHPGGVHVDSPGIQVVKRWILVWLEWPRSATFLPLLSMFLPGGHQVSYTEWVVSM